MRQIQDQKPLLDEIKALASRLVEASAAFKLAGDREKAKACHQAARTALRAQEALSVDLTAIGDA